MALVSVVIDTPLTATQDAANLQMNGADSWYNVKRLFAWLRGFVSGAKIGNMKVKVGTIQASATVTFTSTGPANDEFGFIARVAVSAKTTVTSPTVEFQRSDTPSVVAANFASMINTSALFNPYMTASAVGGVVTVTIITPGTVGNAIEIGSVNFSNTTITGSGFFTNGSNGTSYNLTLGKLIS